MSLSKHALQIAFDTLFSLIGNKELWTKTKDEVLQIETAKAHLTGAEKFQEIKEILVVFAKNYGIPVGSALLSFLIEAGVQYVRLVVL
jgi:hypothetical protein